MVESAFPIISTPSLERALAFWRDALGGVVNYRFPGDGAAQFVALDLGRSQLGLGLVEGTSPSAAGGPISIWCYVADCDAVTDRVRAAGFSVVEEPADQPWGERIARVLDADANMVILGDERRS